MKTIVWILALVVIAGAGFAYYYLYLKTPKPSVVLEVSKPDRVFLGEPFEVTLVYSNESEQLLKNAQLSVVLPEGVFALSGVTDRRVIEEAMGDLGPGSLSRKSFSLIATEGSQSLKRIEMELRYGISDSPRTSFRTPAYADISVGPPAVSLDLEVPEEVFSGETFDMTLRYRNDADYEFRNVVFSFDHPSGFDIDEITDEPGIRKEGDGSWNVGTIEQGEEGELTLKGTLTGEEGSSLEIVAKASAEFFGERYGLGDQAARVGISKAPLSVRVEPNGTHDYIAKIGDTIRYRLIYRNNSSVALRNITLRAELSGDLFDLQTLNTRGAFNSLTHTASWSTANVPELSLLPPGEERFVEFVVSLRRGFPIKGLSDKNYSLKVRAEAVSPTIPPGVTAKEVIAVSTLETKVEGRVEISTKGYFFDAASGILNKGPYPPRVNQPTQYTVHWAVTNYATDVKDVRISAFLQSGAVFTGVVKSTIPSEPSYNPATGEVVWNIPSLVATRGVISSPPEAIFQIELTPAVNQGGREIDFLGETVIEAYDEFVGKILRDTDDALGTSLPDDKNITTPYRQVQS